MNFIAALIAATTFVANVNGNTAYLSRQLILEGHAVADSSNYYIAAVRSSPNEMNLCSDVLISSLHVLTTKMCVEGVEDETFLYAAIVPRCIMGLKFLNGMQDDERIKIMTIKIHPTTFITTR